MADIPDTDDEFEDNEGTIPSSSTQQSTAVISIDSSPLFQGERPFRGFLRDESLIPTTPETTPTNPVAPQATQADPEATPEPTPQSFKARVQNIFRGPRAGTSPRTQAPMNATLSVMPKPGMENWQEILMAHAKLNANGEPTDEKGKVINLRDMNPEFGQRLAQTCLDLDDAGYKGQYSILSGVRTHEEQAYLYHHYKSRGSSHPVAVPGHSPHEWGVGTDFTYSGNNSQAFYAALHHKGVRNGLEGVDGDINHVQIAHAPQVMAELRQKKPGVEMASNNRAPAGRNAANPAA